MVKVSQRFVIAVKLAAEPAYRIAQRAGIHPAELSRIIHGATTVREDDRRVLAIAQVLGLPADQAFDTEPHGNEAA